MINVLNNYPERDPIKKKFRKFYNNKRNVRKILFIYKAINLLIFYKMI